MSIFSFFICAIKMNFLRVHTKIPIEIQYEKLRLLSSAETRWIGRNKLSLWKLHNRLQIIKQRPSPCSCVWFLLKINTRNPFFGISSYPCEILWKTDRNTRSMVKISTVRDRCFLIVAGNPDKQSRLLCSRSKCI